MKKDKNTQSSKKFFGIQSAVLEYARWVPRGVFSAFWHPLLNTLQTKVEYQPRPTYHPMECLGTHSALTLDTQHFFFLSTTCVFFLFSLQCTSVLPH